MRLVSRRILIRRKNFRVKLAVLESHCCELKKKTGKIANDSGTY
jgi:hypothetical protein